MGRKRGPWGQCQAPDCERQVRSSCAVLCEMHYYRLRRTGTVEQLRPWNRRAAICTVDGCDNPEHGIGLCSMHEARQRRHGSPDVVIPPKDRAAPRGEDNPQWTGDDATYLAVHRRIANLRGPANRYLCTDCGSPARQWSYDHADRAEKVDQQRGAYSVDLTHYQPRCVPCHKRFDLAHKAAVLAGGAQ